MTEAPDTHNVRGFFSRHTTNTVAVVSHHLSGSSRVIAWYVIPGGAGTARPVLVPP